MNRSSKMQKKILLEFLKESFAVCKLKEVQAADPKSRFFFLSKTDKEVSLVVEEKYAPSNALKIEKDWAAFRVVGELDFSLVGILSKISSCLANAKVSIFAVSTFDTDYVLIKRKDLDKARQALAKDYELTESY